MRKVAYHAGPCAATVSAVRCTGTRLLGQRGVRLDESTPGHGLGLAISQDIVEFYGGGMELGCDPDLGGLAVEIRLPGR